MSVEACTECVCVEFKAWLCVEEICNSEVGDEPVSPQHQALLCFQWAPRNQHTQFVNEASFINRKRLCVTVVGQFRGLIDDEPAIIHLKQNTSL